jgi:hypothetical protein
MISFFLFHSEVIGQPPHLSLLELQRFMVDTYSQNRKYHKNIKQLFARFFELARDPNVMIEMFNQYSSEDSSKCVGLLKA